MFFCVKREALQAISSFLEEIVESYLAVSKHTGVRQISPEYVIIEVEIRQNIGAFWYLTLGV